LLKNAEAAVDGRNVYASTGWISDLVQRVEFEAARRDLFLDCASLRDPSGPRCIPAGAEAGE